MDQALGLIGETRAGFRVDGEIMLTRTGSHGKLPIFDQWFAHPLRIPFYERHIRNTLLDSQGNLHPLFNTCASLIGIGTRRDLIAPAPLGKYALRAQETDALRKAILALDANASNLAVEKIPAHIQQLAAMLLFATADAIEWRNMALKDLPKDKLPGLYQALTEPLERPAKDTLHPAEDFPQGIRAFDEQMDLLDRIDLKLLAAGMDDLSAVVDSACAALKADSSQTSFEFRCTTRYGTILLARTGDEVYSADRSYLLILDLRGNDTYRAGGATTDDAHPVSILIDATGNDVYDAANGKPAFGAGVLGYGIVADLAGNDRYTTSGFYAEGCGMAGVGLLRDDGGNDVYSALGEAQGFGGWGVGILTDRAGDDSLLVYNDAQGCGIPRGMGLLLDLAGDDHYLANDSDIQFPSPQSDKHNSSMVQGAGYGLRRDYVDGNSQAGGVGMLLDAAGNDQYSGGVFSQAVGYWYAIGILDDRAGNDSYSDTWYGQSATAHMGISYLNDGGGNDVYTSLMTMSAGAAHDFSASLFVDESGDDQYHQQANCLGRSLNNSVALFVDMAGNDHYEGTDAFGTSRSDFEKGLRAEVSATAIFLDLDGTDTYPASGPKNDTNWLQSTPTPIPLLRGVGVDAKGLVVKWD
ncbi:MAG TPA: hypothetical protein VGL38_15185 [bacterium]